MKRDKPRQSIKLLRNKVVNVIALLLVWLNVFSQSQKPRVHIGFVYPISNHGTFAKEYTNSFSFHLLGGVSRSETAFTLSGFTNVIVDSATGVQIAGFSNHIKNVATGVQIAGFVNTYRIGNGLQLAGFTNIACDNVKGLQLSGFLNKAGQTRGLQLTGFTNVAANVTGAQVSGFVNVARKVRGVQISGFINIAAVATTLLGLLT